MRALTASLTVVLGIVAASIGLSACSDSTDSTGSAGAPGKAGASGEAGDDGENAGSTNAGGGGASAGASSGDAGAAGEAGGGPVCSFTSMACFACLQSKCGAEVVGCSGDAACGGGLSQLTICACDGQSTIDECKTSFSETGGESADALVTCYDENCTAVCEG